jgi:hypothetical protein
MVAAITGVSTPPAPAPAPAPADAQSRFASFLHDFGNLFRDPRPIASIDQRIATVVRAVRAATGPVVLWVPGTDCDGPTPEFVAAVKRALPTATVITVPYQANWQFQQSVPDGIAVVSGVLDALRAAGCHVLAASESQGSWVLGEAITTHGGGGTVIGAALLEHPGVSTHHIPADPAEALRSRVPVLELNGGDDLVSQPIPGDERNAVIDLIDDFAHRRVFDTIAGFALLAGKDPGLFIGLLQSQAFRVNGKPSPHDSGSRVDAAASFLAAALRG